MIIEIASRCQFVRIIFIIIKWIIISFVNDFKFSKWRHSRLILFCRFAIHLHSLARTFIWPSTPFHQLNSKIKNELNHIIFQRITSNLSPLISSTPNHNSSNNTNPLNTTPRLLSNLPPPILQFSTSFLPVLLNFQFKTVSFIHTTRYKGISGDNFSLFFPPLPSKKNYSPADTYIRGWNSRHYNSPQR